MPTRLTIERRLAIVIALLALLVLWLTLQVPEPSTFMAVGPRFFPYVLGGAMLLSALLLALLPPRVVPPAITEQAAEAVEAAEHTDAAVVAGASDEGRDEPLEWRRVLLLMGLTALYVVAFEPLGFVLSTVPFIVVSARLLGSRHWLRDVIVAVGVAVGIYYLFTQLLRVALPEMPFFGVLIEQVRIAS